MTQPAVTQQINALEKEIGCKLFERTNRIIKPTEKGILLYDYAKKIIQLVDEVTNRIHEDSDNNSNVLSLSYQKQFSSLMDKIFLDYYKLYPKTPASIKLLPSPENEKYTEQELQNGVLYFTKKSNAPDNIPFFTIKEVDVCCFMSEHHPLSKKERIHLCELVNETIYAPTVIPPHCQEVAQAIQKLKSLENSITWIRSDTFSSNLTRIPIEGGICVAPKFSPVDAPGIVSIPIIELDRVSVGYFYLNSINQSTHNLAKLFKSI